MGGGGGTSGKVSYPTFMVNVHNEILQGLTGYMSSDPIPVFVEGWLQKEGLHSAYEGKTPYNPQTMLAGMTESLST